MKICSKGIITLTVVFAMVLVSLGSVRIAEAVDLVLYNGKIVTVDKKFSIAEAVAISNGKFVKVGKNAEIRALASPKTKQINLKGKMVTPGFIDSHPHLIHFGKRATDVVVNLEGLDSIVAIKQRIAERVQKTPPGQWVACTPVGTPPDYFHLPEQFKEKRWPTRWDLDEVAPNNPVFIGAPATYCPHPGIMNSYALKVMGVTKDTPDEPGGVRIQKDPQTGEPNGLLDEMHIYNLNPFRMKLVRMLPRPTFEQMVGGVKNIMKKYNATGVTAVYEGHYTIAEDWALYKTLWDRNELNLRVYFTFEEPLRKSVEEIERWMKESGHNTGKGFGDDLLMIGGATISIDNAVQQGLALFNKPYIGPYGETTSGVQIIPTDKAKKIAQLAAMYNIRLNFQVCGDKAGDIALEAFEEANKTIPIKDRRWLLQHMQHPTDGNIDKCKELGVVVTTFTGSEYTKGEEIFVKRLGGGHYIDKVMPLRLWIDKGVPIAQSTDGAHYDAMFTLWNSLKRTDGRTGKSLMNKYKQITREEALKLYTINSAYVIFMEDKIGSIEPGKLADLVILNRDILKCSIDDILTTKALCTMVGGKAVHGSLDALR